MTPPRRPRSLLSQAVAVVLLPVVAVLVALGAVSAVEHRARTNIQVAEHTVESRIAADRVQALLVDAETGVRGYVATGDPAFLETYDAALRDLPAAIARFDRLRSDDPTGDDGVAPAARDALARLAALRAAGAQAPPARRAALARAGKAAMDRARAAVANVDRQERAEQTAQVAATSSTERAVDVLTGVVALAGVLGGFGGAAYLTRRVIRRLRLVQRNAELLAQGEPLEPDGGGDDEIGRLSRALRDTAALLADQRARLDLALELGGIQVFELRGEEFTTARYPEAGRVPFGDAMSYLHPDDVAHVTAALAEVAETGVTREYDVRFEDTWLASRVTRVSHPDGDVIVGVAMDVTARKRAEAEVRERGRHNELLLASAGEGIYTIDPSFVCTSVNPAGARMLGYETTDLVGRDLHTLVHNRYPDGTPYAAADCPIHRSVRDGEAVRVEGEVFWRSDGSRLPVEYASYPLLEEGVVHGAVVTFSDASERHAAREETERAAADLRRAIAEGELVLHYQPKVDLRTGRCVAVEALVRWQRGDTLVYPDAFIPLAEQTGVIDELTRWVVEEALRTAVGWRQEGRDVKVAVNLSPPSLRDDSVVAHLAVAAGRLGCAPSVLEAEITESALAEDPDALLRNLIQLAAMGVHAAIDDFGTGFSSLSYLKVLPLRDLKIDKSFVMNMVDDERDRAIVTSTIGLAHSLGLRAVAEGVENEQVVELLRDGGCDIGQGYHFSRPVPRAEIEDWLTARMR
jgi:PAS domain S-box-containing protein